MPDLTCPFCGTCAPMEVFASLHPGASEAIALALQVPPPLATSLHRYLALFAPPKNKLTHPRLVAVLKPLVAAIKAGKIVVFKRELMISLAQWEAGFEHMAAKRSELGQLKNHNYLLKVLAGYVEKTEAKEEAQQIEGLRTGADLAGARHASPLPAEGGAAAWDAERAQVAERSRALGLAASELKSSQRLNVKASAETLIQFLTSQNISHGTALFVANKLFPDTAKTFSGRNGSGQNPTEPNP